MNKRQDLTRAAEKVLARAYGRGWSVDYHVLEGTAAYARLFATFAKLIEQHRNEPFWVFRRELTRLTKMPPRAYAYALFKFENEELLMTAGPKIIVTEENIKNWGELCQRVLSRLEERT